MTKKLFNIIVYDQVANLCRIRTLKFFIFKIIRQNKL